MFLRTQPGASAAAVDICLAGLFSIYSLLRQGQIIDLPGVNLSTGDITILIGFGSKAFSISGARRPRPQDLGPQHNFRGPDAAGGGRLLAGSGLSYANGVIRNPATEGFVIQVIAETPLAANRAIVENALYLEKQLDQLTGAQTIQLACAFTGFNREDGRSWINFHDGLSNLASGQNRQDAIEVKPQGGAEDQWTTGGTYLTFIRLGVDLSSWRKLSQQQQELIVGRSKISGCPLTGVDDAGLPVTPPACPFAGTNTVSESGNDAFREAPVIVDSTVRASHIQRANHHIGPIDFPVSRRIYR